MNASDMCQLGISHLSIKPSYKPFRGKAKLNKTVLCSLDFHTMALQNNIPPIEKSTIPAASAPGPTVPFIIDNRDVTTPDTFNVHNPAKGVVEHKCSAAVVEHATKAVDSADRAFSAWSSTKPATRRDILLKTSDIFLARKDEFVRYMCEETGSQAEFAEFILMLGVNLLKDVAGKISGIEAASPALSQDGTSALVFKQPYGVVLGIAPWYVHWNATWASN